MSYLTYRVLLSACVLTICSTSAFALKDPIPQIKHQLNFNTYTTFDGLPQGQVLAVYQDKLGYIWSGSYAGITRYNGREFNTLTDHLPSFTVKAIAESQNGELAFGTGAGLCILKKSKTLNCETRSEKLPYSNILDLIKGNNNDFWIAAEGGVTHWKDDKSSSFSTHNDVATSEYPIGDHVSTIVLDQSNRVWIGTDNGVSRLVNGVFEPVAREQFSKHSIRALLSNQQGIWVGSNDGLHLIIPDSHGTSFRVERKMQNISVLSLFEDSNGNIWIGTYQGLYRMVNGQLQFLPAQGGLDNAAINDIFEDREHNIWLGSDNGLVKYVPGPFVSYSTSQGMTHPMVRAMSLAPDGEVWMGTRDGVSIYNPQLETFRQLQDALNAKSLRVYALLHLGEQGVLIGTREGLIHWSLDNKATSVGVEQGLPSKFVSAFHRDSLGRVWVGTTKGLALWDKGTVKISDPATSQLGAIYSIKSDSHGRLWIGSSNKGLVVYDPDNKTFDFLENIVEANRYLIWSIDIDSEDNAWIGTNGDGLLKINSALQLIEKFDANHEFGDNFVWQVLVSSKNHIWAYTNQGLRRLQNQKVTKYNQADGLVDLEGAATSILEHPNGDLWFGTGKGVMRYIPTQDKSASSIPVNIDSVSHNDKPIMANDKLEQPVDLLTFEFSSLTFKNESDIKFSYRLLGVSNQWSKRQSRNKVVLANLSPGEYTFEVKASNSQAQESNTHASFSFSIKPYFWQSTWFLFAAGIVIVFIILFYIKLRLFYLKREKQKLKEIVQARTRDLQLSNKKLERLATIDELTGLYNRRHFLKSLEHQIMQISRSPTPGDLSILLIDVDFFKKINDSYGHITGDKVLGELAVRLSSNQRQTDLTARYGGEEFASLLPFTDQAGAEKAANKLLRAIADKPFDTSEGQSISVTISIGIHSIKIDDSNDCQSTIEELIKNADKALYLAKENGRNCQQHFARRSYQ